MNELDLWQLAMGGEELSNLSFLEAIWYFLINY